MPLLSENPIFVITSTLAGIQKLGQHPVWRAAHHQYPGRPGGGRRGSTARILPGGADWQIIRPTASPISGRATRCEAAGGLLSGLQRRPAPRAARGHGTARARRDRSIPRSTISAPSCGSRPPTRAPRLAQPHPRHRRAAIARAARCGSTCMRCCELPMDTLSRPACISLGARASDKHVASASRPPSLAAVRRGRRRDPALARPEKRNALDDDTVLGFEASSAAPEPASRRVVLHGRGRRISPPASTFPS